jgi:cation diffusion facilitator CzcD-associated flavoprotein CzcO
MISSDTENHPEQFDVIVVGAGISGINAAYHLKDQCPDSSLLVLETFETYGGTWWSHKYPGIRSDSDLYTFGYRFKPWTGPPIATAEEIRAYMGEVIDDAGLDQHIRYRHKISAASWSSEANLWTITATKLDTQEETQFTAKFLYMGQGYYRHQQGFWPDWQDMDSYQGQLVHSEEWPDGLDYADKDVLVIGSGASAATLVPNMSDKAAHVTMLQRSPTYFLTGRNAIEIADQLRLLDVDETWIHEITRKQQLLNGADFAKRCLAESEVVKQELIGALRAELGEDYDVDTHFTPNYRPWRQRIAFVPDADLFKTIASGDATVVTDEIERFTQSGVLLKSGQELSADLIVAATGFNLSALGDIEFRVDGQMVDLHDTVSYRGMMLTGLPNLVLVFGYFRASWTLRADLVADFTCRLLNHMDATGAAVVSVAPKPEDVGLATSSFVGDDNFNPTYVKRGLHLLPKSGAKPEWQHSQDYWSDKDVIPAIDLTGPEFVYRRDADKI